MPLMEDILWNIALSRLLTANLESRVFNGSSLHDVFFTALLKVVLRLIESQKMPENIYKLVEEPRPPKPKQEFYKSKYDPKGPLIGSTFCMQGTTVVDGKGFDSLKKVSAKKYSQIWFYHLSSSCFHRNDLSIRTTSWALLLEVIPSNPTRSIFFRKGHVNAEQEPAFLRWSIKTEKRTCISHRFLLDMTILQRLSRPRRIMCTVTQ